MKSTRLHKRGYRGFDVNQLRRPDRLQREQVVAVVFDHLVVANALPLADGVSR